MEQSDRLIDKDYTAGLAGYKKANLIFSEARESAISLFTEREPDFENWLRNKSQIQFDMRDKVVFQRLALGFWIL